jgi:hypothetical protein
VTVAAAGLVVSFSAACDLGRERTCSDGQVPAYQVDAPDVGGTCVAEDKKPPPRLATYPPGLVPE